MYIMCIGNVCICFANTSLVGFSVTRTSYCCHCLCYHYHNLKKKTSFLKKKEKKKMTLLSEAHTVVFRSTLTVVSLYSTYPN